MSQIAKRRKEDLSQSVPRYSKLAAPIVQLSGTEGSLYCARYDSTGEKIATAGENKCLYLWESYGENKNYGIIKGHKGPILDLCWNKDSSIIYSVSSDMTLSSWDVYTGNRIKKHIGHKGIVNTLDKNKRGSEIIFTGSDDGCIGIWDPREKICISMISTDFPILSLATDQFGSLFYSAGIDDNITVRDIRKNNSILYTLSGHSDSITSLNVSPNSEFLLSNSMDSSVKIWNINPYVPEGDSRLLKTLDGAPSGMEGNLIRASWNSNSTLVGTGSSDKTTVIWNANTGKMLYKLPGHSGCVNDVRFSQEDVVLSCSSDGTCLLGELPISK